MRNRSDVSLSDIGFLTVKRFENEFINQYAPQHVPVYMHARLLREKQILSFGWRFLSKRVRVELLERRRRHRRLVRETRLPNKDRVRRFPGVRFRKP